MIRDERGQPWPQVKLAELITDGPTNGYSPRSGDNPNGTLSLKLTATTRGVLDLSSKAVKRLNEVISDDSKFWLREGDILFQRSNSREYVGVTAIFTGPPKTYIYPDLMIRVRVATPTLRRWIWRYCSSTVARNYFMNSATGTAGNMPKIQGSTIRDMLVPLPPEARQEALLDRVEKAFESIQAIQGDATRAHELLGRLEEATLAKAFRGALVPQDPHESPVSISPVSLQAKKPARLGHSRAEGEGGSRVRTAGKNTKEDSVEKKRADVRDDHLTESLRTLGGAANARGLWQRSEMDIEEFYKQLRDEMKAGRIEEGTAKEELRLTNAT